MSERAPILFAWDGDAMHPVSQRFAHMADKEYVVGETYNLVAHEFRSMNSHRHYFASVNEAWKNLDEDCSARFPTPEHLRKWALIQCGYRNERTIVAQDAEKAHEIAAFIEDIDDYAVVVVRGSIVCHMTAKSQSMKAMGKKDFGESKTKVLDQISRLLGISTDDLQKNTDRAA